MVFSTLEIMDNNNENNNKTRKYKLLNRIKS